MIRVSELRLELDEDESLLRKKAGKVLRTDPKYIEKLTIFKKSVAVSYTHLTLPTNSRV